MTPIPFVTNRPPCTGGFGPPPPCGLPETLSFGTVGVLASADPARRGLLATPVSVAGALDCSAAGPDAALVGHLARTLAAAVAAREVPLVLVHAGNTGFAGAVTEAADLCAWLRTGPAPLPLAPVAFTWPAVPGATPDDDRARAAASAGAWSRFLRAFAAARALAGQPRCLYLAQSAGVGVTRYGGRALAGIGGLALPADLFARAVLMGGADAIAFGPGEGLDQVARISGTVVLARCRPDPADSPALPANVQVVADWGVGTEAPARDGLCALLSGLPVARRRTARVATRRPKAARQR